MVCMAPPELAMARGLLEMLCLMYRTEPSTNANWVPPGWALLIAKRKRRVPSPTLASVSEVELKDGVLIGVLAWKVSWESLPAPKPKKMAPVHKEGLSDELRVAVETNSAAMTFAYVRAGAGIGIAQGHQRGALGRGLGTRSLAHWLGKARYVFVWLRGAYIPPATRALADCIRAAVTD